MAGAVRLFDEGGEPNTLSALAIEIPPRHQGGGRARTMIGGMRDIAARRGFGSLIAPLRPTWKSATRSRPSSVTRPGRGRTVSRSTPGSGCTSASAPRSSSPCRARCTSRGRSPSGRMDRAAAARERHLRVPARARPARGRPRGRPVRVLGAERVGSPPHRLRGCAFSRSSTSPTRPAASSGTPCASAATSSTSGTSRSGSTRPDRALRRGARLRRRDARRPG